MVFPDPLAPIQTVRTMLIDCDLRIRGKQRGKNCFTRREKGEDFGGVGKREKRGKEGVEAGRQGGVRIYGEGVGRGVERNGGG